MNKSKLLMTIIVILSIISIGLTVGVTVYAVGEIIDPKTNVTIKNCESCYTNNQIGFDYKGNHYIIPRYDFQGDRTLNQTLLSEIAKNLDARTSISKSFVPDKDIRLRQGAVIT